MEDHIGRPPLGLSQIHALGLERQEEVLVCFMIENDNLLGFALPKRAGLEGVFAKHDRLSVP